MPKMANLAGLAARPEINSRISSRKSKLSYLLLSNIVHNLNHCCIRFIDTIVRYNVRFSRSRPISMNHIT